MDIVDPEIISPAVTDLTDDISKQIEKQMIINNPIFNITNNELVQADRDSDNDNRELDETAKTKVLIETVGPILDEYNKKYNLNFKMESFADTLKFIASIDKNTRQLKEIIDSQLITDLCQITIVKSITTLSYLIMSQLNNVMSPQYITELNPNTCQVVNSVFMWIEKLEVLKDKYTQYDIDKKIKNLKASSSENSDSDWVNKAYELLKNSYKEELNG